MTILYNRALLTAKTEVVFRTDPVADETVKSFVFVDGDVDTAADEIDETNHGFVTGDGPVQLTTTGVLPAGLSLLTNYWIETGTVAADDIQFHLTRAAAISNATPVTITAAVGGGNHTLTENESDALLVEDPNVTVEVTQLDRNNVRTHIGTLPSRTARKVATATFAHEVRGPGTLLGLKAPAVGTLLRACGYAETYIEAGTGTILDDAAVAVWGPNNSDGTPDGAFTYTKTTGYSGADAELPRLITLECTTGGGTGVAVFTVSSPASGAQIADTASVTMTDGATFDLTGLAVPCQITIDAAGITSDFAIGDTFTIQLAPPGVMYTPISTGFESITLKIFYDGIMHEINGARGTFTIEGAAADFARFNFTFTGDYEDVVDLALPLAPVYESTLPPQVELAAISAAGGVAGVISGLCAQSFTVDSGNDVQIRECINGADSTEGALIVGRNPTGAFNPEVELEATHPFWANLSGGARITYGLRVGSVQGNVLSFFAPYAQYRELAYNNRNEIRAYDVTLGFAVDDDAGNDEIRLMFS